MSSEALLARLAKIKGAAAPVVSVYLNTRWADEHQRERVRVFLKSQLHRARQAEGHREIARDLDWIQAEGQALLEQSRFPDAQGVALFACQALRLREVIPVRVPFENAFVIADTPFLRPFAGAVDETPETLVVFVDSRTARLIPLTPGGAADEVALESDVPGHHRRGGWAQLAQSRYQRHIHDHRGRHLEAVAAALIQLVEDRGVERVVIAGAPRIATALRQHLPPRIHRLIAASIPASRHEPSSALAARATERLAELEAGERAATLDAVLTEAAKGGRAVAGIEEALEAAQRGAVHQLYLLRDFRASGRVCLTCGALQPGEGSTCRRCRGETKSVELGEALVDRVVGAGGGITVLDAHPGLQRRRRGRSPPLPAVMPGARALHQPQLLLVSHIP